MNPEIQRWALALSNECPAGRGIASHTPLSVGDRSAYRHCFPVGRPPDVVCYKFPVSYDMLDGMAKTWAQVNMDLATGW